MNITEAVENYLETIFLLSKRISGVHAVDICTELGFSRPTVSEMLKQLKTNGLIIIDDSNHITLTEEGTKVALRIYERHVVISKLLIKIGVDKDTAYEDACKIEHDISDVTFECIKNYVKENTD